MQKYSTAAAEKVRRQTYEVLDRQQTEKTHGELGLADAIKNNCNDFIYRYSTEVGISEILIASDHFGLGQKSRLAARNQSSIPDPEWLKM
ncbi:MAG: hypothetical protein ACKVJU_25025 [Verrucomicrobiales bacterium]